MADPVNDSTRDLRPSNATAKGLAVGAPVSALIAWGFSYFGILLPVEAVAAIGTVVGQVVAYFSRGGRVGEPH